MADEIKQVDCYRLITDDSAQMSALRKALSESGINLQAFAESPRGAGKSQIEIVIEGGEVAQNTIRNMGFSRCEGKSGFLIQGEDRPGAMAGLMTLLAGAQIAITAVQAISAGAGRFGALIWVEAQDMPKTTTLLAPHDQVDESSEESFPASDPPSWATTYIGYPQRV